MSRRHPRPSARPARILELYGQDLRWSAADRGLHLDADTAERLHDEGFTMATIRVGLWRTKRVSLNRWVQQGSSRRRTVLTPPRAEDGRVAPARPAAGPRLSEQ